MPICHTKNMAELSYDDVRRAAQEAMRELQSVVYGLQNSHNDLKRAVSQSNQYQLSDILNRLTNVQQQINTLNAAVRNASSQPAPIHYTIQQSVADLHRRLGRVEQFMEVCYRYFDTLQREENESQEF
jgi:flagellar biosynthesis chaperone FliJ